MFEKDFKKQKNFYKGCYRSNSFRRENFSSRKHVNKYFDKQSAYSWQTKVLYCFGAFVFLYLIYFFFFSGYFVIDNIMIEGNNRIDGTYVKELAYKTINQKKLLIFKNNNYFLFNSNNIKKELEKNNSLESLDIDKKYFSSIFIKIKEKEAKFAYINNTNNYLVDKEGNVIAKVDENNKEFKSTNIVIRVIATQTIINQKEIDEQNRVASSTSSSTTQWVDKIIPQIQDVYPSLPEMGKSVFSKSVAEKISYIDQSYRERIKDSKIEGYEYDNLKELFITMLDRGIKVYFKLDENLEFQIANLAQYFEKNPDIKNLKYIDLRQKDQIIIK